MPEDRFALKATLYYLALESDYPAGTSADFLDREGRVLHQGAPDFLKAALVEGSAKIRGGRVLNVAGKVGGQQRWAFSNTPFGLGSTGCPLVPLLSAAIDRAVIPLRSVLRIEETKGLPRSDGTSHDGIWYTHDGGSAIKGHRIDLFVGAGKAAMKPVYDHGIRHMQTLDVTVLSRFDGCAPDPDLMGPTTA